MLKLEPSTFESFLDECTKGNVVPVVRTVLADLQTPVSAYLKISGNSDHAFLLESVEGGERVARYSFLGANPEMVVRSKRGHTLVSHGAGEETIMMRADQFIRQYFDDHRLARRPGLAPLAGGAVGFLGYDAVRWFEPSLGPSRHDQLNHFGDALWMVFRTILAFDKVKQQIEITTVVLTDDARGDRESLRKLYQDAVDETARIERLLAEPFIGGGLSSEAQETEPLAFASNWTREGFEDGVRKIKERIAAGDCYQVVLSQRFSTEVDVDPVSIYRALRASNPSPYMFFFRLGGDSIIGASPEMLVRCRGQRLDYRPIAGTRKRGATEPEDWMLGEEMRTDEKEVAEHMMLVDLGRNDLGRVSDFGTVEVESLMVVERYSHVQHLVSALRGRLKDNLDRFDALASCFPAGTVTGAPKVSAMKIIDELEPDSRGVYAGAILYLDYADNLDSCIAIRTITVQGKTASVQAGAGIVADSEPEFEYEETVNKARALVRAIEMAQRGL